MSDAVGSLTKTLGLYREFPLALILAGIIHVIGTVIGALIPFGQLVITPALTAGLYGLFLGIKTNDKIRFKSAINTVDEYIGPLIAAYILQGLIILAVSFLLVILAAFIPVSADAIAPPLLALLGFVAVAVFISVQFFPIILVREGAGPANSITQSVSFVRNNLISVIFYSALKFSVVIGLYAVGPYLISLTPRGVESSSPLVGAGYALFALGAVVAPVLSASMHVEYYERRRESPSSDESVATSQESQEW